MKAHITIIYNKVGGFTIDLIPEQNRDEVIISAEKMISDLTKELKKYYKKKKIDIDIQSEIKW